jgi:hypothetical protein
MKLKSGLVRFFLWLFIIVLFSVFLAYVDYDVVQKKNIEKRIDSDIDFIHLVFDGLIEEDVKSFSVGLDALMNDEAIKQKYLEKDRDGLYVYLDEFFQDIKRDYGITHWYFILPDGYTFLRMHNKELYDDEITRHTFWEAQETDGIGSGIELGKTAYALRVVAPYYQNDTLIGYMELGEEIDHFLHFLEDKVGGDFALLAKKELLNKAKYVSVRNIAGLEDNWGDLNYNVVLDSTAEDGLLDKCFDDEILSEIYNGRTGFNDFEDGEDVYRCAGFVIEDAKGDSAGAIMFVENLDSYISDAKYSAYKTFVFSFLVMIAILLMNYFLPVFSVRRVKK